MATLRHGLSVRKFARLGSVQAWISLGIAACLVVFLLAASAYPKPHDIQSRLTKFIRRPCLKSANVGLYVKSLNRGEVLFNSGGRKPLIPASNVKLLTAAAALRHLRADYTFSTVLATDGVQHGRTLQGNLYLIGGGDPSLVPEKLWAIAQKVRTLGIDTITGDLIYDDYFLDQQRFAEGWENEVGESYHAPISALSLNFNIVTLHIYADERRRRPARITVTPETGYVELLNKVITGKRGTSPSITIKSSRAGRRERILLTGSIPVGGAPQRRRRAVLAPSLYTAITFREYLLLQGTRVVGSTRRAPTPQNTPVLVRHESKRLAAILADLNKFSNNFVAEQLLKSLGAEKYGPPGTWAKGVQAVSELLTELEIKPPEYQISDGSGLSRLNHLSPRLLVRVLQSMYQDFEVLPEYLSSLGIVGADGLVEKRLKGTEAERNLRVKTGTLRGVASLSGYAHTKAKEVLAFSFIVNNTPCAYSRLRRLQNQLSLMLVNFTR